MAAPRRIRTRIGEAAGNSSTGKQEKIVLEEEEEPVTPAGRVFLQPELYICALCVLGFKQQIDVEAFKNELLHTLVKHKRFSSLVRLNKWGRESWVRTQVNIDDHVIVPRLSESELESPRVVENYVAKLSKHELDMNKPLWEVHVLNTTTNTFPDSAPVKARGVCIFLLHHSLGDGISLMSLLLACTRRADDPQLLPSVPLGKVSRQNSSGLAAIWKIWLVFWYSITEIFKFLYMQLWQSDSETIIKGYRGAEKESNHFSTVHLNLDDLKVVKNAVAGATINDVFLALISMAFKRYLKHNMSTTPDDSSLGKLRVRALSIMNTRASPGLQELAEMMKTDGSRARWGNSIGYILIPLTLKNLKHPLDYVKEANAISTKKKLSFEAWFTYVGGTLVMKLLGVKAATELTYQSVLHTSISISNVVGPVEEVTFAGNSLEYIIPTSSQLPQGLLLHLSSYMGRATLSLMINKKIITDPDLLSKCFHHALQELVTDAKRKDSLKQ